MPTFIWRGTDPEGKQKSERVDAENAQVAKAELIQRGWTNLQLVGDEIIDAVAAAVEIPEDFEEQPDDVELEVQRLEGKHPDFFSLWWKGIVDSKRILIFFTIIIAIGFYRGARTKSLIILGSAGIIFMVLLYPVIHAFFSLGSRYYSRLNRAKVWGRWTEVLECVERLRQVRSWTRVGPGEIELVRCRAQALAALGRLDDALEEFTRFSNSPNLPEWLYLSHLAGIYDCAKQFDKSTECRRTVTELKPDMAASWIDLAYGLVRGLNRPAEARQALARAETCEIPVMGQPYMPFLKGISAWRENKMADAKPLLDQALEGFQPFAHHDLMEGTMLLTKSYLCAVEGSLGNEARAKKLFKETETFLVAGKEQELLEACRRAISRPNVA
jgi:tetratricopeptide (TPR) repeat protein